MQVNKTLITQAMGKEENQMNNLKNLWQICQEVVAGNQPFPDNFFADWFCNYNLNTGDSAGFNINVTPIPPGTVWNQPYSSVVFQLFALNDLAGQPFQPKQLAMLWQNFLGMIFHLFANSLPYAQQTGGDVVGQVDLITVTGQQYIAGINSNIPFYFLQSVDAYLSMYLQDIFQYFLRITVNLRQWSMVQNSYTVKHTRSEDVSENTGSNTTNQTSGVSQTSFNPVSNNAQSFFIPTVNVGQTQIPSTSNNTIPSGQSVSSENTASYNTHGSGSNNNFLENQQRNVSENYTTQDLNAYKNIGMSDVKQALKPLIYKLSTLFWTLGNDEFPDNSMWGFNIW